MNISKRAAVRIVSLSAAVVSVLGIKTGLYRARANDYEQTLKYSYYRAVEDLSSAADSISNTLEKEIYASTPLMHSKLSAQLMNYAYSAKASLEQLPIESMGLSNTYKFLSQVGSFSQAMSEKLSRGEKLSEEEYENMKKLLEYSKSLSESMWALNDKVGTGQTIMIEDSEQPNAELLNTGSSFSDFENSFENYPKLIYDGPFSDNILEKEPTMLKGLEEISKDKALEKSIMILGVNAKDIPNLSYEYGKMPSYRFYDDNGNLCCAVTKQGGIVSYFLKQRRINSTDITNEQALEYAKKFLDTLGMIEMQSTYYEIYDNVCTINFAYTKNNIIMYTDLIKVQVSMADGEIVGYDARGYIVNHTERSRNGNTISIKRASKEVSPALSITNQRLCYIPTQGGREVLCYEFSCLSDTGRRVLVYINARTAAEEQILMITENESGVLTI